MYIHYVSLLTYNVIFLHASECFLSHQANGLDHYASSSNKTELYGFLARYVMKVHPDTDIKNDLKNNEGFCLLTG
jgi:hypothetical protein